MNRRQTNLLPLLLCPVRYLDKDRCVEKHSGDHRRIQSQTVLYVYIYICIIYTYNIYTGVRFSTSWKVASRATNIAK